MSQIIFNEISNTIKNSLHAQANYQYVMLNHILVNGYSSKTEISKALAKANNSDKVSFYRQVPVYKVLVRKGLVKEFKKNGEYYYDLAQTNNLTNQEKDDLIKCAQSGKRSYEK